MILFSISTESNQCQVFYDCIYKGIQTHYQPVSLNSLCVIVIFSLVLNPISTFCDHSFWTFLALTPVDKVQEKKVLIAREERGFWQFACKASLQLWYLPLLSKIEI